MCAKRMIGRGAEPAMSPEQAFEQMLGLQEMLDAHSAHIRGKSEELDTLLNGHFEHIADRQRQIRDRASHNEGLNGWVLHLTGHLERFIASGARRVFGHRAMRRMVALVQQYASQLRQHQKALAEVSDGTVTEQRQQRLVSMPASIRGGLKAPDCRRVRRAITILREAYDQHMEVIALLGKIISATYEPSASDEAYRHFDALLRKDYMEFSSDENENYPEEARLYDKLKDVDARMWQIRHAPLLSQRIICAVAGGFSGGKSSFLNTLIGSDILPTNITPTTSIPTFITYEKGRDDLSIGVFNPSGGRIEVEEETLQRITHDFEESYGIVLNRILDRVIIYTPDLGRHPTIAFVDTPGYSKAGDAREGRHQDEAIAREQVLGARFLIWLMDCEKGQLPQTDIDFMKDYLERRQSAEQTIYIVINKADKKREEDLPKILDVVAETVAAQEIGVAGIGVYSALQGKWYLHHGMPFDDFLEGIDKQELEFELVNIVKSVFEEYEDYHTGETKWFRGKLGLINRVNFLLEEADSGEKLRQKWDEFGDYLKKRFGIHQELAQQAAKLSRAMSQAVEDYMQAIKEETEQSRHAAANS